MEPSGIRSVYVRERHPLVLVINGEKDVMKTTFMVSFLILIAGCASRGPDRISEQNPMVTYRYGTGEVERAKLDAARYCHDNYGRAARVIEDVRDGNQRAVTFACVVTP
jgi:hypothetical protein